MSLSYRNPHDIARAVFTGAGDIAQLLTPREVRGSAQHRHAALVPGRQRIGAVYLCCMRATRTQVYLTDDQRRMIDEIAQAEGVTLAEVVRRALDAYLRAERDAADALASTFGADPDAAMPSRDGWDRG